MRTESSLTHRLAGGNLQTELFAAAIHYKDAAGKWQGIDNRLVASARSGYGFENKANAYKFLVSSDACKGVRFEAGGHWLTIAPSDAPT